MKNPTNDIAKKGQLAGRKLSFGPANRYAIAPVHSRLGAICWMVWDAERLVLDTPMVIRQADTAAEALSGFPNADRIDWVRSQLGAR